MTDIIKETVITQGTSVKQAQPAAKGDAPQEVYETKKTIFRFNQVVWYILGIVEVLLVFRLALKALGANPAAGFTSIVYALTDPLTAPFRGILGTIVSGSTVIEWSTLIAGIVYLCVAWGFIYLMDLIYPITPRDVNTQ